MKKVTTTGELFSIVPQALTACKHFNDSEFRVLVYILGTYQTKMADGTTWTYSVASLAACSVPSIRTVQRVVKRFTSLGILKLYGKLLNERQYYNIYTFNLTNLQAILNKRAEFTIIKDSNISNDNLSSLNSIDTTTQTECLGDTFNSSGDRSDDTSGDNSDDKLPPRRNIVEGISIKGISLEGKIPEPTSDGIDNLIEQIKGTVQTTETKKHRELEHDRLYAAIKETHSFYSTGWKQAVSELNEQFPEYFIKF